MIKIIYYSPGADVVACARKLKAQGSVCFAQEFFDTSMLTVASVDSEATEAAAAFLHHHLRRCSSFEKTFIISTLCGKFYRASRYVFSIKPYIDRGIPVVLFIPLEQLNVYDLVFTALSSCTFHRLSDSGDEVSESLETLVEFFGDEKIGLRSIFEKTIEWCNGFFNEFRRMLIRRSRSEKETILFIAHDNDNHLYLKAIIPILHEIERRNRKYFVLACDGRAKNFLEEEKINYIDLYKVLNLDNARPERFEKINMERWFKKNTSKKRRKTENFLYEKLLDLTRNSSMRRDAWNLKKQADWILDFSIKNNVKDVFFVPDGTPIASMLCESFKSQGVGLHTLLTAGIGKGKRTISYHFADKIYCQGRYSLEILREHGCSSEVVPVGSPALYQYLSSSSLKISDDRRVVLIATSGFDHHEVDWMKALAESVDAEKTMLVLKPHPVYPERYQRLCSVFKKHLILSSNALIEPWVNACRLIITDHSQVGIDAHLLGKPVISMYQGPGDILYMRGIKSIRYIRDFPKLLKAVEQDEALPWVDPDFIEDFNSGGDSYYDRRVVDQIIEN